MNVAIQPVGPLESGVLEAAGAYIREFLASEVTRCPSIDIPLHSYDPRRRQYSSPAFMLALAAVDRGVSDRTLGITAADLFIPMLTFVFGQAQFQGRLALVSTARLAQNFYGIEDDPDLLRVRLFKEIGHELGHSFGLIHCRNQQCLMSLATAIQDVDRKSDRLCRSCRYLLDQQLTQIGEGNREIQMADFDS